MTESTCTDYTPQMIRIGVQKTISLFHNRILNRIAMQESSRLLDRQLLVLCDVESLAYNNGEDVR
jgi:hypothetical protein